MPFYPLSCPECDHQQDSFLPVNDPPATPCEACGFLLIRREHQNYQAKNTQIQGETVSGGCNYTGWDDGLQCHVKSKRHRSEIMKARGLVPFTPDPVQQAHRDTIKRIKKDTKPGDPEAQAAIAKETKEADYKRRRKATEKAFEKVTPAALLQ